MTDKEKQATINFIDAFLVVEAAKEVLRKKQLSFQQSAKILTEHWWLTDEKNNIVATIPDNFAIPHNGKYFFISIDIEATHKHKIIEIVILEQDSDMLHHL